MRKNTPSMKIAFCGIIAALSLVLMFLGGLIPVATVAIPAVAGCLLIAVVTEVGVKWGFCVYAVCAVLSLLLTADREAALFYILFFGYYPVLYAVLGKIKRKAFRYVVKLLLFNVAAAAELALSVWVLKIPLEGMAQFGPLLLIGGTLLMNGLFLVYDKAMDGLIVVYLQRFHGKINQMFRL